MQKVQMEEIVLRFLYKNTNSFNITDKNVMLQPKICKVYVPVTARLSLFILNTTSSI